MKMEKLKNLKEGDIFITKSGLKIIYSHTDEYGLLMFKMNTDKNEMYIPYRPNGTRYNCNDVGFDITEKFINENYTAEDRIEESLNGNKLVYDYIDKIPDDKDFLEKYKRYTEAKTIMSPLEYARYLQFCEDHKHPDIDRGAIGGGLIISYMPTGLGDIVKVKCDLCGAEADITDINSW